MLRTHKDEMGCLGMQNWITKAQDRGKMEKGGGGGHSRLKVVVVAP